MSQNKMEVLPDIPVTITPIRSNSETAPASTSTESFEPTHTEENQGTSTSAPLIETNLHTGSTEPHDPPAPDEDLSVQRFCLRCPASDARG